MIEFPDLVGQKPITDDDKTAAIKKVTELMQAEAQFAMRVDNIGTALRTVAKENAAQVSKLATAINNLLADDQQTNKDGRVGFAALASAIGLALGHLKRPDLRAVVGTAVIDFAIDFGKTCAEGYAEIAANKAAASTEDDEPAGDVGGVNE